MSLNPPSQACDTLADLIDEYLEELEPRVSGRTLDLRRTVLERLLLPWAEGEGITGIDELGVREVGRFSRRLQLEPGARGKALSPVTVKTYGREVNIFLAWAAQHGGVAALRVESPPLRRAATDLELLTPEEVKAIEAAAIAPRDKLIVRVLAETGVRVGELLSVRPCDVVKDGRRCFLVVRGKTGTRVLGIEPTLYRRLRAHADGGRPGGEEDPLFVALATTGPRAGRALTRSGIDQLVRELARRAGIRKRVYPHLLRHTYATNYYRDTQDAVTLKAILGHRSLAMIERVYVHLAADDVHDAMVAHLQGRKAKGRAG